MAPLIDDVNNLLFRDKNVPQERPNDSKPSIHDVLSSLQKIKACIVRGEHFWQEREHQYSEVESKKFTTYFMKLFDVDDVCGVYTRAYDVYIRYYEMANVLNTLRELLQLGEGPKILAFLSDSAQKHYGYKVFQRYNNDFFNIHHCITFRLKIKKDENKF